MLENKIEVSETATTVQINSNNITTAGQQLAHTTATTPSVNPDRPKSWAPDLHRLASALSVLDPDCDEYTWKFKRLAPMANTAKAFPEYSEALYRLAIAWSRGDLQNAGSRAWVTPGSNGKSGKQIFNSVWGRFLNNTFTGRPSTIGTIYHEAKAQGWVPPEERFEGADKELN